MKTLITLHDLNNMDHLAKLADGFLIGNADFGIRLTKSFSIAEINLTIHQAKQLKKSIFLVANQIMTNQQIEKFKVFFKQVDSEYLTGIIVGDVGLFSLFKDLKIANKVIYHPSTLLTNSYDVKYLDQDQVMGCFIAKELTLAEIIAIAKTKKQVKTFFTGHGYLEMFYSKRLLLSNFETYLKENHNLENNHQLTIKEEMRPDANYPILQESHGTSIFRSKVFSMINDFEQLQKHLDYFVVDTIFMNDEYGVDILKLYQGLITIDDLKQKYKIEFDDGFLHNPTFYKR